MEGGGRLGFKAVALNLQGCFKDVALNGGVSDVLFSRV